VRRRERQRRYRQNLKARTQQPNPVLMPSPFVLVSPMSHPSLSSRPNPVQSLPLSHPQNNQSCIKVTQQGPFSPGEEDVMDDEILIAHHAAMAATVTVLSSTE
jgi:hypothetical protein